MRQGYLQALSSDRSATRWLKGTKPSHSRVSSPRLTQRKRYREHIASVGWIRRESYVAGYGDTYSLLEVRIGIGVRAHHHSTLPPDQPCRCDRNGPANLSGSRVDCSGP